VKVLAFDPGQKKIGWGVLEQTESSILILGSGKINEKKWNSEIPNLIEIYKPDCVAYEFTGQFLNKIYTKILLEATTKFLIPAIGCKVHNVRQATYSDSEMTKSDTIQILKEKIYNIKDNISKDELDAISIGLFILDINLTKEN